MSEVRTETTFVRVGDRQYPIKYVKMCKTCRSKYRHEIEQALLNGLPYKMIIAQAVEPYDDHSPLGPPSEQGIQGHVRKGHMPIPFSVQRIEIENRAKELGRHIENGEQILVDGIGMLRSITQRAFERINSGEIQPTIGDLMTALRIEASLTSGQQDPADSDAWKKAFIAYMEVVKANVPPEVFQRISEEMRTSPVMSQLAERKSREIG